MMKRTSVWLSRQQNERLELLARRTGVKRAELIRRFIDNGLNEGKGRRFQLDGPSGEPVALLRGYSLDELRSILGRGKAPSGNVVFLEKRKGSRRGKRRE